LFWCGELTHEVYPSISDTSYTETELAATNCEWFGVLFANAEQITSVQDVEKDYIQMITTGAIFVRLRLS